MVKILDFWAQWCYPCKIMEPVLEEVMGELKDKVVIEKINIDENLTKAQEFNIMSIPTYILIKDGKVVDKLIGATSKENFATFIKKHLNNN